MTARYLFLSLVMLAAASACKPAYMVPEGTAASFSFAAGDAQYASLKESVTLKVDYAGNRPVSVDWGDGTREKRSDAEFSHSYVKPGKYAVKAGVGREKQEWTVEIGPLLALSEAVKELYGSDRIWVMAHRAHTSDKSVPENSIPAVNAAIAAGADVLETDTHRTRDGKVVISHDDRIDAHTNGKGKIADMSLEEIRQYRLTDRDGKVTSETMPTLEEFLLAARGRAYVNLDFSPRTASTDEVLTIVEKLGMVQQVFMYCNSAAFVKQVFERNPEANAYAKNDYYTSLLEGRHTYFLQTRWCYDLTEDTDCVVRSREADSKGVLCSANLLHVNFSYIPEYSIDEAQLSNLMAIYPECHMIQTDCPAELVSILNEKGRR